MKRSATLRMLFAAILLGLASFACSMSDLAGPPSIGEVVTAKSLDAAYKPVDPTTEYTSDDTIYVSVEVKNLVLGSKVNVQYKRGDELYQETSLTADEAGSGYYGFKLSTESGHTPGSYTAEVYLNDKLEATIPFKVEASGPPSIGEAVATKSLDESYKPAEPTSTYSPGDVFYISVQVKNLVEGSVVEVKYKYEGQDYGETTLTADQFGSGYYGFKLSAPDEHPAGAYTAEVYLDGKLQKTVEFSVE